MTTITYRDYLICGLLMQLKYQNDTIKFCFNRYPELLENKQVAPVNGTPSASIERIAMQALRKIYQVIPETLMQHVRGTDVMLICMLDRWFHDEAITYEVMHLHDLESNMKPKCHNVMVQIRIGNPIRLLLRDNHIIILREEILSCICNIYILKRKMTHFDRYVLFSSLPNLVSVRPFSSSFLLEGYGVIEGRIYALLNQLTRNLCVEGNTDTKCSTIHRRMNYEWSKNYENSQCIISEKKNTWNLPLEPEFLYRRKVLLQMTKHFFGTQTRRGDETDEKTPRWLEYRPVPQQEIAVYMLSSATHVNTKKHRDAEPEYFNSDMRKELTRYGSFIAWPDSSAAWPSRLASSGFFYGGSLDNVNCFYCGVVRGGWIPGACPLEVHRRISPTCPFVMTRAGDIPIVDEADEEVKNYMDRLSQQVQTTTLPRLGGAANTQIGNPQTIGGQQPSIDPNQDAEHRYPSSGYYSMPQETAGEIEPLSPIQEYNSREPKNSSSLVPSSQRLLTSSTGRTEHDAHIRSLQPQSFNSGTPSSTASSVVPPLDTGSQVPQTTSATASRAALASDRSRGIAQAARSSKDPEKLEFGGNLGICLDRPKYPDYAVATTRVNTYSQKWPHSSFLLPKDLAEAGYYYSGYGDSVKCFFCGIGLKNWDLTDNPWIEHARWSPKCSYLNLSRGMEFVQLVQELSNDGDQIGYNQVMDILKDIQPFADKTRTPDATEMSTPSVHSKDIAEPAELGDNNIESKDDASLLEENELMRQQTMCKVCMDNDVSIVFLPCGHLACCVECAPALRECPICRSRVRGTVRAFMS